MRLEGMVLRFATRYIPLSPLYHLAAKQDRLGWLNSSSFLCFLKYKIPAISRIVFLPLTEYLSSRTTVPHNPPFTMSDFFHYLSLFSAIVMPYGTKPPLTSSPPSSDAHSIKLLFRVSPTPCKPSSPVHNFLALPVPIPGTRPVRVSYTPTDGGLDPKLALVFVLTVFVFVITLVNKLDVKPSTWCPRFSFSVNIPHFPSKCIVR